MIKLSIKDQEEPAEIKEKVFNGILYLKQCSDNSGNVNLMMRTDDFDWFILRLKVDGTIYKGISIANDIGLQVDDDGKIIESEE